MKLQIIAAILLTTHIAIAAEPVQTIPAGDDKIVAVSAGQAAPFTGQLFDNNTAIRWGNWLQQYKLRLSVDVAAQQNVDQIQIDLLSKKLDLELARYATVTQDYQKQLALLQEELRNPPFYKTPWFGFTCGIIASVALVTATAVVIHEVK
jgi:hypothetical protein